jgi:hypothetical protein
MRAPRWAAGLAVAGLAGLGAASAQVVAEGPCPSMCSGNGLCHGTSCSCFHGFLGGDCSQRYCPVGKAWSDAATGVDDAHNEVECSNRGACDRLTGKCTCDFGFTGRACEMSQCPNDCYGRGRCLDMSYNARYKDPGQGSIYSYASVWDAEKIYGCVCDEGFSGYDCSLRDCPIGDDPMTTTQVDDVQLLQCSAGGGFFTLTFQGRTSEPIAANTMLPEFKSLLQAIPGVGEVDVVFSEIGVAVCSTTLNQVVSVTFKSVFGKVPALVVKSTHINSCSAPNAARFNLCGGSQVIVATDGASLSPSSGSTLFSVTGTKETEYCSRRGRCDLTTGVCSCFVNFVTSDGRGGEGVRGDCGFDSAEIQACPGLISCSGHGVCSQATEFRCSCSVGWKSGDCSVRTCPVGKSWFDLPIANERAHQLVECSNMGVCDGTAGVCVCHEGFTGAACDLMVCPGQGTCSGHGRCLSQGQLANFALVNGDLAYTTYGMVPNDPLRWDYDMVQGCLCDPGFEGHDCSQRSCPRGDDPETGFDAPDRQVHETQLLRCTADGGSAVLYFRTHYTAPIPFDADRVALRAALLELDSITDALVTYSSGAQFCDPAGANVVSVTFTQELGELPAMQAFATGNGATLTLTSSSPTLEVAVHGTPLGGLSSVTGTMENIECSGRGICDYSTGTCNCFKGFGSSDGNLGVGNRGDCGWRIPWPQDTSALVSGGGSGGGGSGSGNV